MRHKTAPAVANLNYIPKGEEGATDKLFRLQQTNERLRPELPKLREAESKCSSTTKIRQLASRGWNTFGSPDFLLVYAAQRTLDASKGYRILLVSRINRPCWSV